jgi:hypothetical protein
MKCLQSVHEGNSHYSYKSSKLKQAFGVSTVFVQTQGWENMNSKYLKIYWGGDKKGKERYGGPNIIRNSVVYRSPDIMAVILYTKEIKMG